MIDAKRIEEMKRLTAEATPGPYYIDGAVDVHSAIGGEVAAVWDGGATLEFIAESRQFVPDIIAAYEEQAEEIARLRKTLIDIYEYTSDLTIVQTITRRHHDIPLEAE